MTSLIPSMKLEKCPYLNKCIHVNNPNECAYSHKEAIIIPQLDIDSLPVLEESPFDHNPDKIDYSCSFNNDDENQN